MKDKIKTIMFVGLLLFISFVNVLEPSKVFSTKENRYLQELPKLNLDNLISGKFSTEFEKYASDQFINRDSWISLKTIGDLVLLKKDNNRVYFGKNNYLFDVDGELDEEQFRKNMDNINIFLSNLSKYNKDIEINALLIPTKSQVLKDKLPLYAPIIDEKAIVDRVESLLSDNINILDLLNIYKEKNNEYIYYKTDHHWTTKGAYYAYKLYLESMGENPLAIQDFIITKVNDEFLGTSYRKANFYLGSPDQIYSYIPKKEINYNITINNDIKDNSIYDESYLNKTDKYSYFLGGDKPLIEIETSVKNDKTILIIKDSFANSFVPFLVNNYEEVIIIDPRYYKIDIMDYIRRNDIDEVLMLFNIQNFVQEKSFDNLSR
ncbi:MAG: DHHW family protein [Tissierellaceae bacterium]|nr:DHHW family protein [Tissierellaceae bacterium]